METKETKSEALQAKHARLVKTRGEYSAEAERALAAMLHARSDS
jgi:hypothetical protein